MRLPFCLVSLVLLTTCTSYWSAPPNFSVEMEIVDERGEPIAEAQIDLESESLRADKNGHVELISLTSPVLAVIDADGYIPEPVPIGWESAGRTLQVRLLNDGAGKRVVMHFGGDVMFGRRYETVEIGEPLIPANNAAQGASQVVEPIRRLFSLADFRVINLETVVTELPYSAAYPGKRFLLRSHPDSIQALLDLGADLVTAANNHSRDFLDIGVSHTNAALERLSMPQVGGGLSADEAEAPIIIDKNGTKIGVFSFTTVNGSFVNDNYPRDSEAMPAGVAAKDAWIWEKRMWQSPDPEWNYPMAARRIGEVWAKYSAREESLSPTANATIWASMMETYPGLQDWVARRGHGGAALWDAKSAAPKIKELKKRADIVILQLHAGFQFQPAPSEAVREAAQQAIDAGVDTVICHHPHVLQGIEWYRGKLIVYSLGNFIFDQDFLSTFASGVLRMVWEGSKLIEARFIPSVLQAYKPTPVVDRAARRVLTELWERSTMQASSLRDDTNAVRVRLNEPGMASESSHFIIEHNTARLVSARASIVRELSLAKGETLELAPDELTRANLGLERDEAPDVMIGREIFAWGAFEDESVNETVDGAMHWALGENENKSVIFGSAASGRGFLRLHKWSGSEAKLLARSVARIPLTTHRMWQDAAKDGLEPADPLAHYTVRFKARLNRDAPTSVLVDVYHFDDSDPTEDPESVPLARVELPFTVPVGDWTPIELELDLEGIGNSDELPNMIMPYVSISAPDERTADLDIDEFTVVEWRQADQMPQLFGAYALIRNEGSASHTLAIEVLRPTDEK